MYFKSRSKFPQQESHASSHYIIISIKSLNFVLLSISSSVPSQTHVSSYKSAHMRQIAGAIGFDGSQSPSTSSKMFRAFSTISCS